MQKLFEDDFKEQDKLDMLRPIDGLVLNTEQKMQDVFKKFLDGREIKFEMYDLVRGRKFFSDINELVAAAKRVRNVIKFKNRLRNQCRDIFIQFMFKEDLYGEIQLIYQDPESSLAQMKFNHTLYEIIRCPIGSIFRVLTQGLESKEETNEAEINRQIRRLVDNGTAEVHIKVTYVVPGYEGE